jgi:hypothetical protein
MPGLISKLPDIRMNQNLAHFFRLSLEPQTVGTRSKYPSVCSGYLYEVRLIFFTFMFGGVEHPKQTLTWDYCVRNSKSVLYPLTNESIEMFRETSAALSNSVMLYSNGKDSFVLLHPAQGLWHRSHFKTESLTELCQEISSRV